MSSLLLSNPNLSTSFLPSLVMKTQERRRFVPFLEALKSQDVLWTHHLEKCNERDKRVSDNNSNRERAASKQDNKLFDRGGCKAASRSVTHSLSLLPAGRPAVGATLNTAHFLE
ncbi:hypothetical protein CUMW_271510 [Citrus unshiu]|uniref:Uncharacterized protein n=1 Tax=Citrus unshiu TaxID=55188 RepID=A0A2H5QXP0_CITUN|nr:hypothetical protein CUMW_271510 [Citrus unshiu]